MGDSCELGFASLILNVVRVLDEVIGELNEAEVLLVPRSELNVTALSRVDLIAGRELALDQEALTMARSWSQHDFDTTLLDGTPIQTFVILLLKLQQATNEK